MAKSYRIRTKLGTDQNIRVNIEQDFDFLEILSLKLRQEDVYSQFCADYGIVVGRVVANGGFGIPNAKISIFVPVEEMDLQDPVISALYPYTSPVDKNEDGYRYNLLPYENQYGGHNATGTFPNRGDVLTRREVLEIYEKYYKYTVKTNESGDFMITGVPLGNQKIVMDLDLSDMGCFSLRPQDLIRMNMGVEEQFDGTNFKSSEDIDSLPQIINEVRDVFVTPFWGQEDLCNIGITRTDFDLRALGIDVKPTAVFMGSIFSDNDNRPIKKNCKPRTEQGDLCNLSTGPGEILAVRQTIDIDDNGDPILEQYELQNGGKVIDENGTFLVDVPMNLDYVVTNEYGETIISNDPSIGVPTKGKYRFKVKYQSEENGPAINQDALFPIRGEIQRANFVVPQIREHGWTGTSINSGKDPSSLSNSIIQNVLFSDPTQIEETKTVSIPAGNSVEVLSNPDASKVEVYVNNILQTQKWIDFPNGGTLEIKVTKQTTTNGGITTGNNVTIQISRNSYNYIQFQKSYAFSLNWDDYADKNAAINCEDSFYLMNYNKVYTPSQLIDEYRKGYGRARFLGIKEILDRGCEGDTNKFPVNDGVRNFSLLFLIINILLLVYTPLILSITVIGHVICFIWKYLRIFFSIIATAFFGFIVTLCNIVKGAAWIFGQASKITCPAYTIVTLQKKCPLSAIPLPNLSYPDCQACACEGRDAGEDETLDEDSIVQSNVSSLADFNSSFYFDRLNALDDGDTNNDWNTKFRSGFQIVMAGLETGQQEEEFSKAPYADKNYNPATKKEFASADLPLAEKLNLFNAKAKYHDYGGFNSIKVQVNKNIPVNSSKSHTDNVMVMVIDPSEISNYGAGQLVTFQNPDNSTDPNVDNITGNTTFNSNGITNVTVPYMALNQSSSSVVYEITGGTENIEYKFPTDVEYFQVITATTISDFISNHNGSTSVGYNTSYNNTFAKRYLFGWQKVKKDAGEGPDYYPTDNANKEFEFNVPAVQLNSEWQNMVVVFLVRGVDPNTPRQNVEYNLSKLYGYTSLSGPVKVSGDYYLNLPIQPYSSSGNKGIVRHDEVSTNAGTDSASRRLFFKSFTFTPSQTDYQTYSTTSHRNYSAYSSKDKEKIGMSVTATKSLGNSVSTTNNTVSVKNSGSWDKMISVTSTGNNDYRWGYYDDEIVEGVGALFCKDKPNNNETDYVFMSPTYYRLYPNDIITMSDNEYTLMRTDRLPTSDTHDKRFVLHQNSKFAVYKVNEDGSTVKISTGSNDGFGDGSDDFNEDAGSISSAITATFSCDGMVPLECYSGDGQNIGVLPEDDKCYYVDKAKEVKKMYKGCYYLITKNFAILEDIQSIAEWKARFRMMFALCNNVVSLTFVNNWINGSLYMFAFQKDDIYSNDINSSKFLTNPEYQYCKDTIIYQEQNNSFFYRVSPYNNGFIGRDNTPQQNILGQTNAANTKFLGNPTTIMDLGPRDRFIKEICYNPEFQGYIVDTIRTSSYNDTSDLLQLFAISRLTSSGFWGQIIGLGDASVQGLFSRPNSRLDGDMSQLLSINSEYGVIPYLGTNYSDDDVIYLEDNNHPTLGVFFQSNTVNRDMITPGRFTFQDVQGSFLYDYYGFNDQEIPFYKWELTNGSTIFGTEDNDWYTKKQSGGIDSIKYQSIDRMLSGPEFDSEGVSPSIRRPGYIYNSKINGTQIEPKSTMNNRPDAFMMGSPYFFYFGLRKGGSSMNRFIDKFVFNSDIL